MRIAQMVIAPVTNYPRRHYISIYQTVARVDLDRLDYEDSMLSDADLERYARQVVMPHIGEDGQERLLAAKVLVVGAGWAHRLFSI